MQFTYQQAEELLQQIRFLQSIMIDVATGNALIDQRNEIYRTTYRKVSSSIIALYDVGVSITNPNPYRHLWEWYNGWKKAFPTYQERRMHIFEMYNDLIANLDDILEKQKPTSDDILENMRQVFNAKPQSPVTVSEPIFEISASLAKLSADHPDQRKVGFIMMRFATTPLHISITNAIKQTLLSKGLVGLRADDKEYHDDLFANIQTYIHGCGFGIAVIERIERDEFNSNVALEIGYMLALKKPVCILKDKTIQVLQADLIGRLYKQFDPQDIGKTIPDQLTKWLLDKGFIS